jgi:hypothetical protein
LEDGAAAHGREDVGRCSGCEAICVGGAARHCQMGRGVDIIRSRGSARGLWKSEWVVVYVFNIFKHVHEGGIVVEEKRPKTSHVRELN